MSTTELRDGATFGPEGDVLSYEPRPVDRRALRAVLALVVVAALAAGGWLVWQRLQPPPDFTLAQLQGAYTGMVRSDGTNEVSTIDASKFGEPPLSIVPDVCAPMFASTVSNQFPSAALDGVSTYWLNEGGASISLFTVRYPDRTAAAAAYTSVAQAAASCDGKSVRFSGREGAGQVHAVPVVTGEDTREQVAYRWDRNGGDGRYVLHLLRLSNTVTWQFRYENAPLDTTSGSVVSGPTFDGTADQQLMDGVAAQLLSVQAAAGS